MRQVKGKPDDLPDTVSPESVRQALGQLGILGEPRPIETKFSRRFREVLKRMFFHVYRFGQKTGWNIFPSHYYTSEPNIVSLSQMREDWINPSRMAGIDTSPERQFKAMEKICEPYKNEYAPNLAFVIGSQREFGPGFGSVEAQCLHAMVRYFKPTRIIEIGSGISTLCSLVAGLVNEKESRQRSRLHASSRSLVRLC